MTNSKPGYYGAFFWVATVAFVVPLVVAATAFNSFPVATKPTPAPDVSGVDHGLWDYLLKTYVDGGLVDYDGLSRDYLFHTYLRQLGACDVDKLSTESDRLALLINAYNAFVINGVITHGIDDSVLNYQSDGKEFFDLPEHILARHTMSLNNLEHNIIRRVYAEPRVHVVLVCAAKSCPAIRPEAYTGSQLADQLEDQSRLFANSTKYVVFDQETRQVSLSPILQWYGDDWKNEGGYLAWLSERVSDPQIRDALAAVQQGTNSVVWLNYDWALNSQTTTGVAPGGARETAFGSGSVPNQ